MRKHALLSASGSAKWLNCPASARLEEHIPDTFSSYAEEGTLAHALAEAILLNDEVEIKKLKEDELFYPGMVDEVEIYTGYVEERINELKVKDKSVKMYVEQKLDLTSYVPEGFGTGDCVLIANKTLEIIDLKFGKGVPVDPTFNSQLMLYALGALDEFEFLYDIENVTITVAQVRLDGIKSWTIPKKDLRAWGIETVIPKAKEAFEGKTDPVPGEWCRSGFCKYRNRCKKYAESIEDIYNKYKDNDLSNDDYSRILYKADDIDTWIKEIKETALKKMLQGEHIPGFKVVEGRSNRKINDEDGLANKLISLGYKDEEIYKPKAIQTLGNLEKLVGKKKFNEVGDGYIIKPQGKPTIAEESDKRPAFNSAEEDFEFN